MKTCLYFLVLFLSLCHACSHSDSSFTERAHLDHSDDIFFFTVGSEEETSRSQIPSPILAKKILESCESDV